MMRLVVLFAVLLKIQTVFAAQIKVSTAAYQAIVNESGFISSLKVGGCEVLGEPMQFCVGTNWGLERTERRNGDRELLVHLNSDRGKGQLFYRFEENRIAVSMTILVAFKVGKFVLAMKSSLLRICSAEMLTVLKRSNMLSADRFVRHRLCLLRAFNGFGFTFATVRDCFSGTTVGAHLLILTKLVRCAISLTAGIYMKAVSQ